jgi:hypothetical protein
MHMTVSKKLTVICHIGWYSGGSNRKICEHEMLRNIRNLDYVILLCEEILRTRASYHEVLRFPIYRGNNEWVEMNVGATLLTSANVSNLTTV